MTVRTEPRRGSHGVAHYHFARVWAGRNDDHVHLFADGSEPWHRYDKAARRRSLRLLIGMMRREKEEGYVA